jgi:1-acyl-sn-glycerol-3-phosphate acyltransferase
VARSLVAALAERNSPPGSPLRDLRSSGLLRGSRDLDRAGRDQALAGNEASGTSRAARRWRQVRLGAAFVEFGIASLTVAFVIGPLLRALARGQEEAELAVQRAVHRAYAFSVACWKVFGVLTLEDGGLDGLAEEGPCVVVANHPTLMDVVLLGSRLPQMDCIVNAGWTANSPFLKRAIELAGYVRNDAGQAAVDDCAARLRRGRKVLVFAEGTRSPRGALGKFHRGAAHIALASGAPVVAVTIRCRPRMLGSGRKWHDVPASRSHFELRIAGRLDPSAYLGRGESLPKAARRLTDDLLEIFLQEPHLADA